MLQCLVSLYEVWSNYIPVSKRAWSWRSFCLKYKYYIIYIYLKILLSEIINPTPEIFNLWHCLYYLYKDCSFFYLQGHIWLCSVEHSFHIELYRNNLENLLLYIRFDIRWSFDISDVPLSGRLVHPTFLLNFFMFTSLCFGY